MPRKRTTKKAPARKAAVLSKAANLALEAAAALLEQQSRLNQAKFLDAYAGTGNVSAAAKLAGVGRRTHYDWLKLDPEYAALFLDSVEEAADRLETEARRRAVNGVVEAVWHKGVQVGSVKKYSDTLLIFLLKGTRPEKYSERHVLSGKGKGGSILLEAIVCGPKKDDSSGA